MTPTLVKALVVFAPACMLFCGSVVLFLRAKAVGPFLQLLGSGCLMVVALAHICEAVHLFPSMHWGWSIASVTTLTYRARSSV